MAATQEALYGRLDMALSWSERELPERERTKLVHRLHPYLGKFVPQLAEALLDRYVETYGKPPTTSNFITANPNSCTGMVVETEASCTPGRTRTRSSSSR